MKKLSFLLPAACGLLLATTAQAQPADEQPIEYIFEDDDLLGDAFFSDGDLIRLRVGPARTLLLRPRTQFVRELLKSVEDL